MTPGSSADQEHPTPTRKNGYRYFFHPKHHGDGKVDDARWLPGLKRDDEFLVFDDADFHGIVAENGYLYGLLRGADNKLRDLGIWEEQIAEFPYADAGIPWHGYPIWAATGEAPESSVRRRQRPPKDVFRQMMHLGIISDRERRRLMGGKHV
jgi:hypothetical protein